MSILIKGVKMPREGCKDCPLVKRGRVFDICPFLKREVGGNVERGGKPHDCPIAGLPDHGDLIDRDELMKHGVYMPMPGGNLPLVYMSYVKGAKAVIPAEGSEE